MVRVSSIALMAIAIMDKNCFLFICSFITFVGNIILMREFNKSNKSWGIIPSTSLFVQERILIAFDFFSFQKVPKKWKHLS